MRAYRWIVLVAPLACGRVGFDERDISTATDEPRRLVLGDDHACVRTQTALTCWGQNDHSQVAPVAGNQWTPTEVAPGHTWLEVGLGQNHTCGLDAEGIVWCWGDDSTGQLGLAPPGCGNATSDDGETCDDGNTANADGCNSRCNGIASPPDATTPTQLPGPRRYRRLFAADFTTCAIALDGTLWCWGSNVSYVLGVGDVVDRGTPTQVTIPDAPERDAMWSFVAIGDTHACGLQRDGSAWCWGDNTTGALGQGAVADQPRPRRVDDRPWIDIGAGRQFTCAIDTTRALYCWGTNMQHQLGLADGLARDVPTIVDEIPSSRLGVGHYHACAIRADHTAACWGDNDAGEVGNGAPSMTQPTPASLPNEWRELDGGESFTCGIDVDGRGWCWGEASSGRLGNNSESMSSAAPLQTF